MKAENILGGLDICCVRKPKKFGGARGYKGGANAPLCPPLNATLPGAAMVRK